MTDLEVRKIDDEFVLVLTPGIVETLGLVEGVELIVLSADHGQLHLCTRKAEAERQYAIGLKVMQDFSETFAALART